MSKVERIEITQEYIDDAKAHPFDLDGMRRELIRRALVARAVADSGRDYLDSMGEALGKFVDPPIISTKAIAGVGPSIESAEAHANRYGQAAAALLPRALAKTLRSSAQQRERDVQRRKNIPFMRQIEHPATEESVTII